MEDESEHTRYKYASACPGLGLTGFLELAGMPASSELGWRTPSMRGYSVAPSLPDEEERWEVCKQLACPAAAATTKKDVSWRATGARLCWTRRRKRWALVSAPRLYGADSSAALLIDMSETLQRVDGLQIGSNWRTPAICLPT